MAYYTRTINVDDNKVKEAVSTTKQAARTGTTSRGIFGVSFVDDLS